MTIDKTVERSALSTLCLLEDGIQQTIIFKVKVCGYGLEHNCKYLIPNFVINLDDNEYYRCIYGKKEKDYL